MNTPSNPLMNSGPPLRVLYSFPFRIGAQRICATAWHQVGGVAEAGMEVTVMTGSQAEPLPPEVAVCTTLASGRLRIPLRVLGRCQAANIHDWRTARWLEDHAGQIDVVHGWPLASLRTMQVAKDAGIPFLLERPNAHTAYAYEAALQESQRVGIELPAHHDHQYNERYLAHEELEYARADYLLCPSEFVAETFRERGFNDRKLLRHHYGYDEHRIRPGIQDAREDRGLVVLYAGVCEPRKGLHYALEAWLQSSASRRGRFLICGEFVPGYAERLDGMLHHQGVKWLGHRIDLPDLMRAADVFVLPSVEEGSALVTYEARGAGCVLLVSDSAGAVCRHEENALVHPRRDVAALAADFTRLDQCRDEWKRLRMASLATVDEITWTSAGRTLVSLYAKAAASRKTTAIGTPAFCP